MSVSMCEPCGFRRQDIEDVLLARSSSAVVPTA